MANGEPDGQLEQLLAYLKESRGFDFTGYKRASLTRRIQRRMQVAGVETYPDYMGLLEANPGEFAELFNTILINVTGFMRDPEAWQYVGENVVPALAERAEQSQPVRVWSAGAASGQEAYSLAVLLADQMGEDQFRSMVKIYATDADEDALIEARHARYPTSDVVSAFGEERAARYFEVEGTSAVFRQDLRRSLIFGRHDLVQHPPISRIDLLVCRNTLMYFTAEMQRRVLTSFHFALAEDGYLFLGKSEAMVTRSKLFEADNLKQRVFRRVPGRDSERLALAEILPARALPAPVADHDGMMRGAFEESPVAQLIVSPNGEIVAVNRHARMLFGLRIDTAGKYLKDIELSYRPAELRSLVDDVMTNRHPAALHDVPWATAAGEQDYLDVLLLPVNFDGSHGVTITFTQVGRYKLLRDELERSQRELEGAYEELQSTVEELETTNEELQSTNEELETTNEELHSTNEELETMNEELQSTNEELETANGELRDRSSELDEANTFLQSILASLRSGVVVLTRDMTVRTWNRKAQDLWGLRAEEVEDSHFLNLDIGLPVDQLRPAIRACLSGASEGEEVQLAAVNRRGRPFQCLVTVTPLWEDEATIGAILVMEPVQE